MQEDRGSLLPGRMTWSQSIRPGANRTLHHTFTGIDFAGCLLAIINLIFYHHLALQMFRGYVLYFACTLIVAVFAGFVYQIIFPNKEIIRFLGMGAFFIIGMMMYQSFIM